MSIENRIGRTLMKTGITSPKKETRRRTVDTECKSMRKTWDEMEMITKDRQQLRDRVSASYVCWYE